MYYAKPNPALSIQPAWPLLQWEWFTAAVISFMNGHKNMVLNSWKMTMFVTSKKEAEEAAYLNQTRRMDKSTSLSQLQSYLMNWWGASPTANCCQPSKIPQIIWPYCPSAISSIYMYTSRYCKDSHKCWKKCLKMFNNASFINSPFCKATLLLPAKQNSS